MTEQPLKPVLQKPPGYRDPAAPAVRPAPMRKAVLPVSFRTEKRRRNWCRLCCCFATLFLLLLILATAVAGGLFYLWFDPKLPVFHLQSVRIPRFNVTVRPDDGTYLDASVMARIEAKNPNSRLEIYYGATRVGFRVPGEDTGLGSDRVAGFGQEKSNTTSLKVETTVKGQLVEDGVGKRLKSRFKSKELVVEIGVRTRVGYLVRGVRVGAVGLSVTCGGVSLRRLKDGDMPRCTMEILKWIKIN